MNSSSRHPIPERAGPGFVLKLLPGLSLLTLALFAKLTGLDLWVADRFADGVHGFPWAHHWLTQKLLHDGGAWLIRIFAIALLLLAIVRSGAVRRAAVYLLAALALTTGSVAVIKQAVDKDCPWSLDRYGGQQPTLLLVYGTVSGKKPGHCFPGGHSSGGFSLLALYFVARRWRPRDAGKVLVAAAAVGFGFALTQWARGAHFVSHDLTSAAIAWVCAAWLAPFLHRPARTPQPQVGADRPKNARAVAAVASATSSTER
ncbi:phosphatase PAP2 family protein [Sinimarinibacterium sp. CAU 1509]|uniref:phosphatase PAP2 family protein n=1 Tax=Sinimarinibacterium sp. CAU 1509 TaxID=2562283 RepID=UPI00146E9967|nr:phosphatase PAP2 family protein [Sinimarinibacterium sp. CAU 1509]